MSESKTSDGDHRYKTPRPIPTTRQDGDAPLNETRTGARQYGRRNEHNRMKRDAIRDDYTRRPDETQRNPKRRDEPMDGTTDETGTPQRDDKPGRRTTPPRGNERSWQDKTTRENELRKTARRPTTRHERDGRTKRNEKQGERRNGTERNAQRHARRDEKPISNENERRSNARRHDGKRNDGERVG